MNNPSIIVHYLFLFAALLCFFFAFIKRFEPPVAIGWLGLCFLVLDALIFGGQALKS